MPSKKKISKQKKAKTKAKSIGKTPASRVKARRKPAKRTSSQARTSKRSSPRKRTVNPVTDIERELRNKRATSAGAASSQGSDFQGLSRAEEADSESVQELVEEGNVAEAGAVAGVEEADNQDEREVHTHEVPEDDVPEEYLDKE